MSRARRIKQGRLPTQQPPTLDRHRVAAAVHRAVCRYTASDGWGHCVAYAVAGWYLLVGLLRRADLATQVGALRLWPDPGDPTGCIEMDPDKGPWERHAWIAWQDGPAITLVDFSARHYRRYVEAMPVMLSTPGIEPVSRVWRRPDPPLFLWTSDPGSTPWVNLIPREAATHELHAAMIRGEFDALQKLALACYAPEKQRKTTINGGKRPCHRYVLAGQ